MLPQSTLIEISIILTIAIGLSWFTRILLKLPSILGFFITGLICGPFLINLGCMHYGEMLGNLGILFLMFSLGLELSYDRIKSLKKYVSFGFLQVFLCTFLIIFFLNIFLWIFSYCKFELHNIFSLKNIIISISLALSSTVVAMQFLNNCNENEKYVKCSITTLIVQDIVSILLLVCIQMLLSVNHLSMHAILSRVSLILVGKISATVLMLIFVGKSFIKHVFRIFYDYHLQEFFPLLGAGTVIVTSAISSILGLSTELGAFIAGILLSDSEYKHHIVNDIRPFSDLLLGFFFMVAGSLLNVKFLVNHWEEVLIFLLFITVIKFGVIFFLSKRFKLSNTSAIKVATNLCSTGEMMLIIIPSLMSVQFLHYKISKLLNAVTVLSFCVSSILQKIILTYTEKLKKIKYNTNLLEHENYQVVIIGYTKVIDILILIFKERNISYIIIEKSIHKVQLAKEKNINIMYGDGFNYKLLNCINFSNSTICLFNFVSKSYHLTSIKIIKKQFNSIYFISQGHNDYNNSQQNNMHDGLGMALCVFSNMERAIKIARLILTKLNINKTDIKNYLNDFMERHCDLVL